MIFNCLQLRDETIKTKTTSNHYASRTTNSHRIAQHGRVSNRQHSPAICRLEPARRWAAGGVLRWTGGQSNAQCVIAAISRYMHTCNANHGGLFATSRESDSLLDSAHEAVATLFGRILAGRSRVRSQHDHADAGFQPSVSRTWNAGDEIIVTRLDHDANVTPWVLVPAMPASPCGTSRSTGRIARSTSMT